MLVLHLQHIIPQKPDELRRVVADEALVVFAVLVLNLDVLGQGGRQLQLRNGLLIDAALRVEHEDAAQKDGEGKNLRVVRLVALCRLAALGV